MSVDLEQVPCSEYAIAGQLLAAFVAALELTRGGAPEAAVVHPGTMTPDYGGCGLAWTRVVETRPVPGSTVSGCVDQHQVTVEIGMTRCYTTPDRNVMPAPAVLDSAARDTLDDARAMRMAVSALRELTGLRAVADRWQPRGPQGGVHGSTLLVVVWTELGGVGPDEIVPPMLGDPRM